MSTDQRRRQMQGLLAHREREGLTYAELAAECGIPAGTLASWQHRLRREEDEIPFMELVVVDEPEERVPVAPAEPSLEVIGPRGHRVHVTPDVPLDLLERVLSALPC